MMTRRHFILSPDHIQSGDQLILIYQGNLLTRGDDYLWQAADVVAHLQVNTQLHLIDEQNNNLFAAHIDEDVVAGLDAEQRSLRGLVFSGNDTALIDAGKANQVLDWYRAHRFCGACGSPTEAVLAQRAVFCSHCEKQYFPRINPCIIVLVTKGREVLLAHHSRYQSKYYSCLAGFIEMGETAEQTVQREVMEEVNVSVDNIRYVSSQSWPFPSQLMLGFFADYNGGDVVPDGVEIEDAKWFDVAQLPQHPSAGISVAGQLIRRYAELVAYGKF